jgi:hypothetical protein
MPGAGCEVWANAMFRVTDGVKLRVLVSRWDTLQYPASRHLLVPARCSWFNSAHACVLTCVLALCGSEIDIYEYLAEKHGFD